MKLIDKLHMMHRFWRYRLRSEKDEIVFMMEQEASGTTMLDIGANRGIYSYWMSKQATPSGKVFAFEPQPELVTHLEDLRATFKLDNLTIVNKALAEKSGSLALHRAKAGCGGASFNYLEGQKEELMVDLVTLDDYLADMDIPRVSFIKADVEGHELNAFKGAEQIIKRDKPALLFECHHHLAEDGEIFRYLVELGYNGAFIDQGKKVDYKMFNQSPYLEQDQGYRNYVFTHNKENSATH